jgi:hypothetical protein
VISQQTTQKGLWQSQEDIHYHVEEEYDGIPEPDNENPAFNDPPPRPRTRREVIYDYFEAAMLSISDSQLLLGTAQCISFAVTGICTTSQYHYTIALHLVLSACYSSLLAVVLVRDYLRAPLAASVRFILILVLVAALGYVEFYVPGTAEVRHSSGDKTAEDMPAMGRNQSSILLKASCFLDPGLVRDVFDALNKTQDPVAEFHALAINQPLQLNQSRDLQADQSQIQGQDAALGQRRLDALGFQDTYSSPHRAYYIGLVVLFAWAVIVLSVQGCSKFRHRNDRYVDRETARRDLLKGGKKRKFCWLLSWLGPWITAVIVLATIWTYTEDLKRWVAASGWLALRNGKNPEDTVQGLGQVAPLVFVIGVAIATLEKWVRR